MVRGGESGPAAAGAEPGPGQLPGVPGAGSHRAPPAVPQFWGWEERGMEMGTGVWSTGAAGPSGTPT